MRTSKITDSQILEGIMANMTDSAIAKQYGLTQGAIAPRCKRLRASLNGEPEPEPTAPPLATVPWESLRKDMQLLWGKKRFIVRSLDGGTCVLTSMGGQAIPLTDALHTAAGVLPEREALASSGAYANFCFGQGELLASPLQVAAMMNTIACGGICRTPLLLETTLDETTGAPLTALSHVRSRRVLTKRTAAALQALLAGVVAGGTGHEAALPGQTAAGKTGTAQTGQFSGGTELKNYWFAGFVPAEQPRYTIVVLQDTQAEPAFSSAAIFARVAAGLEILAP